MDFTGQNTFLTAFFHCFDYVFAFFIIEIQHVESVREYILFYFVVQGGVCPETR